VKHGQHDNDPHERPLRAVEDPAEDAESGPGPREDGDEGDRLRRRGIYLLPNLITTGALFAGFYAIVAAMQGRFENAAIAVYAAMLLDGADGRVARMTRTESTFGAEYDSLSDMVAFGVAPALVAFTWSLQSLGQLGWVATFIYMACAALRLARFNTGHDNTVFLGLASPAAAAVVAGTVWVLTDSGLDGGDLEGAGAALLGVLTAVVGLLMVAPVRYFSPKLLDLKGRVPFLTLVLIVLAFAVVLADPPKVLLGLFVAYALSGPAQAGWRYMRRRRARA